MSVNFVAIVGSSLRATYEEPAAPGDLDAALVLSPPQWRPQVRSRSQAISRSEDS